MVTFWNLTNLILVLVVLYSLVSILKPFPPFRSRWLALLTVIAAFMAIGTISKPLSQAEQEQQIAEYEARQRLQQEDPVRYAALVATEAEAAARAEAARKQRVAEKLEREAAAAVVAQAQMEDAFLPNLVKIDRHRLTDPILIDQEAGPLKGELVRVTYYNSEPLSESAFLFQASDTYMRVARYVHENRPAASGVQFIVKTDAIDDYGRREPTYAFVLSIPRSEIAKINWSAFIGAYMLNISTVDRKSLGRSIGRSYCESYGDQAPRFCRAVAGR